MTTLTLPPATVANRRRSVETLADLTFRRALLLTTVPGFLAVGSNHPFPIGTTLMVDVAVLLTAIVVGHSAEPDPGRGWRATGYLVASIYLGVKLMLMVLGPTPAGPAEFVQAYKAYIFLIPLTWFAYRACFTRTGLTRTVRMLISIFLIKYALSIAAGNPRPVVWLENNFELMALLGLFLMVFRDLGRRRTLWFFAVGAIVVMSQSRSSVLEFCVVIMCLYLRPNSSKFILYLVPMVVTIFGARGILLERTGPGGYKSTDRWHFFQVFQQELSTWNWHDWIFGRMPLTQLSSYSCSQLAFYQGLFDGDRCYSVTLHAFALRVLFDQGVFGIVVLGLFLWFTLRNVGLPLSIRLGLMGIGLANSLSVSSFNSDYMALPLIVGAALSSRAPDCDSENSEVALPKIDRIVANSGLRRPIGRADAEC